MQKSRIEPPLTFERAGLLQRQRLALGRALTYGAFALVGATVIVFACLSVTDARFCAQPCYAGFLYVPVAVYIGGPIVLVLLVMGIRQLVKYRTIRKAVNSWC